jgi:hypothetical protein
VVDLQAIGTVIGVVGACFAGYNTYERHLDTRLRLKFELLAGWPLESWYWDLDDLAKYKNIGAAEAILINKRVKINEAVISFKIINLSRFPIWIEQVGFSVGKTIKFAKIQALNFINVERNIQSIELPLRLESRESRTYHSRCLLTGLKPENNSGVTHAYIRLSSGEIEFQNIKRIIKFTNYLD